MIPLLWKGWGFITKKTYSLPPQEAEEIRFRIQEIRSRLTELSLQCGRAEDAVTLMAVTKNVCPEKINLALEEGVSVIGENRVQELCEKNLRINAGKSQIHFIGHLQRNKIRDIINRVSCVQSVDSLPLANALSAAAVKAGVEMSCLLEVNIGMEESKSGFSPEGVLDAAGEIAALPNLALRGLMTVQPSEASRKGDDRYFKRMQELFAALREQALPGTRIDTLSTGMSGDYEMAVRCGATMVRIGQGIFGARG